MKKKIILCLMASILLVGCGASMISKKTLEEGLDNYIKSEYNDSNYVVSVEKKKIVVTNDDKKEYVLTYNLNGEPTFTYETVIKEGITYDEYNLKTEALSLPMLGYIASSHTFDVELSDSYTYFILTYLEGMMDYYNEDYTYIVIDDADAEGLETDAEIILTSQFGSKVIDYVKDSYAKDIKIVDEENNTFIYELISRCETTSCTLTAKLTVNEEGKFDEIKGYADELAKENMYIDITETSADYHIELKVGQIIEISGDLTGYELAGMDIVDVSEEYNFTATKEGVANGYLYIGEDEPKTIYITVTEAKKGEKLETKTLKVE